MTTPGDYARLVNEYCEDVARCGVRYAELQLTTALRPFDCLHEAAEAAEHQRDVTVRFIVDAVRNFPPEMSWQMLEAARDIPSVVAMGLGGDENATATDVFAPVFDEARARGLHSAPHAGEVAGSASVREALDLLGAERIQHGVRAVEDPLLLAELVQRGVSLAICPTSNILLGVAASYETHAMRELWDAGVMLSVNTDDPGFFDCDMTSEYAVAGKTLGLDRAGYARLATNSVDGSFAPDSLKA